MKPRVGVIVGSQSDLPVMARCLEQLQEFGIEAEVKVASAHRDPEAVRQWAMAAEHDGLELIIAAAGGAAHLPGVVAAWVNIPVIGVPLASTPLAGQDSLLSIVQMPSGVPVATMAIGDAGASNAAFFAARVLAARHPKVGQAHLAVRQRLRERAKEPGTS